MRAPGSAWRARLSRSWAGSSASPARSSRLGPRPSPPPRLRRCRRAPSDLRSINPERRQDGAVTNGDPIVGAMSIREHLAALRRDGEVLAGVAADTDLDAPVPTCPEWCLRDLVRHLGGVHRWATTYVTTARTTPLDDDGDLERLVDGWPSDADLAEWFARGHAALVAGLGFAPPGPAPLTLLPAPPPRPFFVT